MAHVFTLRMCHGQLFVLDVMVLSENTGLNIQS